MSAIPVSIETSWLDVFTALGTVGTALVAVLALWITICQARATQEQLEEERVLRRADVIRHERVPQLMRVAELHMSVTKGEGGRPEWEGVRAQLWLLPEGMARKLKYEYDANLTEADKQYLIAQSANGELPDASYPEAEVYAELFANIRDAGSDVIKDGADPPNSTRLLSRLRRVLCPVR
jgi:hypothetical protein